MPPRRAEVMPEMFLQLSNLVLAVTRPERSGADATRPNAGWDATSDPLSGCCGARARWAHLRVQEHANGKNGRSVFPRPLHPNSACPPRNAKMGRDSPLIHRDSRKPCC